MSTRRAKPTVLFGGLALIMLVLMVVFGLFLSAQLAKATADFKGLDKERRDLKQEVESKPVAKLREEQARIEYQLAGVNEALPEQEYMPVFTQRIQTLGDRTAVEFKELRPAEYRKGKNLGTASGGAPVGKYGEYDMTFRFSGPFARVFRAVEGLGQLPEMIVLNDLDLKKVTGARGGVPAAPNLDATLDLTAFILEGGAFPGKFVSGSN